MTDSADDLDALFEEMANQRQETETSPSAGTDSASATTNNVMQVG